MGATNITIQEIGTSIYQGPEGTMMNGKIVPSVASNNLTVALKTKAGNDPSVVDPVYVVIGGVTRKITAALANTINAGANQSNAGGAELATKEIDWFVYLCYNTAITGVSIGISRVPYGNLYSDFNQGAQTAENNLAISNGANAGDNVVVIGRFAATLSAGAGYTWSVPTFTNANLIQRPIYETRWLDWVATIGWTAGTAPTGSPTKNDKYKITDDLIALNSYHYGYTPGATVTKGTYSPLPMSSVNVNACYGLVAVGDTPNSCHAYTSASNIYIFCTSSSANTISMQANYRIR